MGDEGTGFFRAAAGALGGLEVESPGGAGGPLGVAEGGVAFECVLNGLQFAGVGGAVDDVEPVVGQGNGGRGETRFIGVGGAGGAGKSS